MHYRALLSSTIHCYAHTTRADTLIHLHHLSICLHRPPQEVARLQAECTAAETELEMLNREQAAIRAEGGELKAKGQELKGAVAGTASALEAAKEERERVKGQIVRSPARVRRELATTAE